jgi:poly-gamma-glutamate capsule biosynthesis protein CapA/YwtB (metallophosphatase superfamily)
MKIKIIIIVFLLCLFGLTSAWLAIFVENYQIRVANSISNQTVKASVKSVIYENNEATVSQPTETRVRFYGDLMIDREVANKMGQKGVDYIFNKVSSSKDFFENQDILVANLEGPFAEKRIATSKTIAFRFDPKNIEGLIKYGFNAFNLANNHSYDMGSKNVYFTHDILANNGIAWFGDELNEGPMYTWTTTTKSGEKIAFLGLHNTYHELDLKKVAEALSVAGSSTDYTIVNVHWGEEYRIFSTKKQQDLAHWLIDNGADAIVGHHPHVIQEFEIYKDKPIFYSLGNFIFDQYFSVPTQTGLGVTLVLSGGNIKQVEITPFIGIKSQLNPMPESDKNKLENWLNQNSRLGDRKIVDWKIIF